MRLDFYHYSYQCPLNGDMLRLLQTFRDRIDVHIYDIAQDRELARKMEMFYPTLTVLNGKRYYSPLREVFLEQAARGVFPREKPYRPRLSEQVITKHLEPLTQENIPAACACCGVPTQCSREKQRFLGAQPQPFYGVLHRDADGTLLGGAEFLPSQVIPYDIPRRPDTAFLTCLYLSDPLYDYKTAPLRALEDRLQPAFRRILAVTDEEGVFPNGDLRFFLRNGYRDEGVLYEDVNYCRLHLVSKSLVCRR